MRLRKHYIQYGETLQSISQIYFDTPSNWIDLIEHNNLKYPYIVDTSEEKKERPEDLVTYGDYLIIPVEGDLQDIQAQEINKRDRDKIVELSLGRDLNITSDSESFNKHGTSDDILAFNDNGQRDLDTVKGLDNLKQQLQTRILTRKGSLLLHPNYGSNLHKLFELNAPEQATKIENEITRTLLTDSRVTEVTTQKWEIDGNQYSGEFSIGILSVEQSINFVLGADESGIFARFE